MGTPYVVAQNPKGLQYMLYEDSGGTIISRMCLMCSRPIDIKVPITRQCLYEMWDRWLDGEHIQNVFTTFTPDEREILISGHCGSCFDDLRV